LFRTAEDSNLQQRGGTVGSRFELCFGGDSGNSRNGVTRKKLKGDFGEMELETPRDRSGTLGPPLVERHQTRWTGFDHKILSMYS
jgi:putative transposase